MGNEDSNASILPWVICVKRGNLCGKSQHKMAYSSGEKGTYEIALNL